MTKNAEPLKAHELDLVAAQAALQSVVVLMIARLAKEAGLKAADIARERSVCTSAWAAIGIEGLRAAVSDHLAAEIAVKADEIFQQVLHQLSTLQEPS